MYERTSKNGTTYRIAGVFDTDNGRMALIERNQAHAKDDWFLLVGAWSVDEAKAKIDSFTA